MIDSEVAEHFAINRDREEYPERSSYSFAGNGHGSARGGIIDGPRTIDRQDVVIENVDVTIEIRSEWYFFAGKPYITVDSDGSKDNLWFLELLKKQLETGDATARIGE